MSVWEGRQAQWEEMLYKWQLPSRFAPEQWLALSMQPPLVNIQEDKASEWNFESVRRSQLSVQEEMREGVESVSCNQVIHQQVQQVFIPTCWTCSMVLLVE